MNPHRLQGSMAAYFNFRFGINQDHIYCPAYVHSIITKIIDESHRLAHVLTIFTVLIVLSFSADYQSLYILDPEHFKNVTLLNDAFFVRFFEFIYFSLITFSSVGYGDIVPISILGKILVMMEIFLSFLVLIFGIANINRIHVDNKQLF